MKAIKIKLMERMLGAELTAHLVYEDSKEAPLGQANRRNGAAHKRLKGKDGALPISVPHDPVARQGMLACPRGGMAVSSLSLSRRVKPGSMGWMIRLSVYMRQG